MGTATGVATNGLITTVTIPDDAAGVDAGDVNVPVGALLDNDVYLASRGVVGVYAYTFDDPADFATPEQWTTTSYVAAANVTVDVPNTKIGDLLIIDMSGYVDFNGTTGHVGHIRLKITEQQGGASPQVINPPGARILGYTVSGAPALANGSMTCKRVVASAGTARVTLEGKVGTNGETMYLINVCTLRVLHLRAF